MHQGRTKLWEGPATDPYLVKEGAKGWLRRAVGYVKVSQGMPFLPKLLSRYLIAM